MTRKQGAWIRVRKTSPGHPNSKIAEAGREIGEKCKGKKGEEFVSCRRKIMERLFPDGRHGHENSDSDKDGKNEL